MKTKIWNFQISKVLGSLQSRHMIFDLLKLLFNPDQMLQTMSIYVNLLFSSIMLNIIILLVQKTKLKTNSWACSDKIENSDAQQFCILLAMSSYSRHIRHNIFTSLDHSFICQWKKTVDQQKNSFSATFWWSTKPSTTSATYGRIRSSQLVWFVAIATFNQLLVPQLVLE